MASRCSASVPLLACPMISNPGIRSTYFASASAAACWSSTINTVNTAVTFRRAYVLCGLRWRILGSP